MAQTAFESPGEWGDCSPRREKIEVEDVKKELKETKIPIPSSVGPESALPEVRYESPRYDNKTDLVEELPRQEKPKHVLFANDRIVKLTDEGNLSFGFVVINRVTRETKLEWDDGQVERMNFVGNKGVSLSSKVGILDRRCIGFGSKVTNGEKIGQVREKRFLVTLVLENNLNVVIKDVPCDDLIRIGYSKKDDKIVYKNEWVGLVADTRAGVYFKMDKDGKLGFVKDDSYGFVFPRPGDKIKSMLIYHLWDTRWITAGQTWWWNFLKYLGNSATILNTEIDCMTIAWMGNIHAGGVSKLKRECLPPITLRQQEEIQEIQHLYGRNWKYIREFDTWNYQVKKEDKLMNFHKWILEISRNSFFGPPENYVCVGEDGKDDIPEIGFQLIASGTPTGTKIAAIKSVLDVEWDDGSLETLPSYEIQPYQYEGTGAVPQYFAGDVVHDVCSGPNSSKYGYIVRVFKDTALVTWVIPDPDGHMPKLSPLTKVSFSEIVPHMNFLFLKSLTHTPVVISNCKNAQGERMAVDGVLIGIVVGINVAESKIIVKCPDQVERLVWAHDFVHFEGDAAYDAMKNKFVQWYLFDDSKNPILDYCSVDGYLRNRSIRPLTSTSVDDVTVKPTSSGTIIENVFDTYRE